MPIGEQERNRFPHLLPGEVAVWRKFLVKYETGWEKFIYDVHVGKGSLPQADPSNRYQQNYTWVTKKRIDVVGYNGRAATIFEVRAKASLPLMGQLIGYKNLWMRENPDMAPPDLVMVCLECPPDDKVVMADNGITVVEVGHETT